MLIKVSVPSFKQGSYIHLAITRNFISFKVGLPNLSKTLPLVIFAIFGILAGILAFWLLETLYSPLAQTVEQAKAWDEDYRIYCCRSHRSAKEEIIMEMSDKEETNDSLVLTYDIFHHWVDPTYSNVAVVLKLPLQSPSLLVVGKGK